MSSAGREGATPMTAPGRDEIPEDLRGLAARCAEQMMNDLPPEMTGIDANEVYPLIERISALTGENRELREQEKRRAWFEDFRPIINAIGEISVQEAMDAIERNLK